MLMFVFGAGASFDSDAHRPFNPRGRSDDEYRPPLASGLFEPVTREARAVALDHPQATPLLMHLRAAAKANEDIEQALEDLLTAYGSYSRTNAQLLALRGYLTQLLDMFGDEWHEQCAGQTNHVTLADAVARHVETTGSEHAALVTFNYDTLLERGVQRATGADLFGDIDAASTGPLLRVYKPHGSVSWRQKASLPGEPEDLVDPMASAVARANELDWRPEFTVDDDLRQLALQDSKDRRAVWLPAVSVPARTKATFMMPADHLEALRGDLGSVTTLVTIGWRAREQHFLDLVRDHVPADADLVAVAENRQAAETTIRELSVTGRWKRWTVSVDGFSGFVARTSREPDLTTGRPSPTLLDVLADRNMGWRHLI